MTDKPSSPFAGLDKALLRSTRPSLAPQRLSDDATLKTTEELSAETPKAKVHSAKRGKASAKAHKQGSVLDSMNDSMIASYHAGGHDSYASTLVDTIRKTVKVPGKEVSFVRLTPDEKGELADIVYTYKRQGKKTSENEINRIAVNFILHDYKANGNTSILARVIDALLA